MKYILILIGILAIGAGIYGYNSEEVINNRGILYSILAILGGSFLVYKGITFKKYNGLNTIILLFLASGISAQSIPELPSIEWDQTSEEVKDIVNAEGTNLKIHSISERSPKSSNIIAGQDTIYTSGIYPNYVFMFVEDKLRMITCNIDWEIHREYLSIVKQEEVSEFYISEEVEFYIWRYKNTSRTLSYDEKGKTIIMSWNYKRN